LTIKFTRSTSCQFSVASSMLEPELEPAIVVSKSFEPG
jgi:hypothetical protein